MPVSLDSRLSKPRALLARLARLSSVLAALAAVAFVLALFGLLPAQRPEPPAKMRFDPAQAVDRPRTLARADAALPVHRLLTWSFPACAAPERGARLYPLALRADRAAFALFCAGEYVLLEVEAADPPLVTRLGRFPFRGELPGGATALDLDLDGLLDLVLGVSPREGVVHRPPAGLFWLRGRAQGGYDPARALIEMPVVAALAVDLDGKGASELVALTRGDAAAQRAGELWIFSGGTLPTRTAVVPSALAPGDLALGADRDGVRDLWVVSQKPGSLVRMGMARAPESWATAPREVLPLPGAIAFVPAVHALYARDGEQVYAIEGATPPKLRAIGERAESGPAVWLERDGKRALLAARPAGFALIEEGEPARVRTLPAGKTVLDVGVIASSGAGTRGVLLLRSEEQPAGLMLVILPEGVREEASEMELRTGAVRVGAFDLKVPLE